MKDIMFNWDCRNEVQPSQNVEVFPEMRRDGKIGVTNGKGGITTPWVRKYFGIGFRRNKE